MPAAFTDEQARAVVRMAAGSSGDTNRQLTG
jgi:hypothetical protein